jgi:hypothetical protein
MPTTTTMKRKTRGRKQEASKGRGHRGADQRPRSYNRLWHLDADNRRYHGLRRWDSGAVEAFVQLASKLDFLYPPDWSRPDRVVFRASGTDIPFASVRTDKPTLLRLVLHIEKPQAAAVMQQRLGIFTRPTKTEDGRNEAEMTIRMPHHFNTPWFAAFIEDYANQFLKMLGLPAKPSMEEEVLEAIQAASGRRKRAQGRGKTPRAKASARG